MGQGTRARDVPCRSPCERTSSSRPWNFLETLECLGQTCPLSVSSRPCPISLTSLSPILSHSTLHGMLPCTSFSQLVVCFGRPCLYIACNIAETANGEVDGTARPDVSKGMGKEGKPKGKGGKTPPALRAQNLAPVGDTGSPLATLSMALSSLRLFRRVSMPEWSVSPTHAQEPKVRTHQHTERPALPCPSLAVCPRPVSAFRAMSSVRTSSGDGVGSERGARTLSARRNLTEQNLPCRLRATQPSRSPWPAFSIRRPSGPPFSSLTEYL